MWLSEAHVNVVETLAFASVVLLTVEKTSGVTHLLMEAIQCSKRTKELLLFMSTHSTAAGECWQFLTRSDLKGRSDLAIPLTQPICRRSAPSMAKRPETLSWQDSAVDVGSPAEDLFNPSPLPPGTDGLSMPIGVEPVFS